MIQRRAALRVRASSRRIIPDGAPAYGRKRNVGRLRECATQTLKALRPATAVMRRHSRRCPACRDVCRRCRAQRTDNECPDGVPPVDTGDATGRPGRYYPRARPDCDYLFETNASRGFALANGHQTETVRCCHRNVLHRVHGDASAFFQQRDFKLFNKTVPYRPPRRGSIKDHVAAVTIGTSSTVSPGWVAINASFDISCLPLKDFGVYTLKTLSNMLVTVIINH